MQKVNFLLFSSSRVDLFVKKQNSRNLSLILNPGRRRRDLNPDQIGGRRVLSPPRHPLLPRKERVKDTRSNG